MTAHYTTQPSLWWAGAAAISSYDYDLFVICGAADGALSYRGVAAILVNLRSLGDSQV